MKDPFIPPKPLLGLSPKILLDENKIKNIESRLMGPNNEGKAPSECQPLKESELENIKTKIILNNPLAPKEIKENINNSSNKKNVINTEIKTEEKFLQKKRILDDKNDKKKEKVKLSQFEEKLLHDNLLNISTEKNNNSSNKSNFSEKSYNNSSSELSPKNNLTNNNLNMNSNTASNKNNKTILDYYPTKFISRSNNNSNIICSFRMYGKKI